MLKITVRNEASEPEAEISVYGPIGESFWDDSRMTEKKFRDALATIPKGRKFKVLWNSQGGSVQDGLGIYNALKERRDDSRSVITGYAMSAASFAPLGAGRVTTPKAAVWMLHKPWSAQDGNADDMRKAAEMLDAHERAMVAIYVEETGKSEQEVIDALRSETWLDGQEAFDWGLADEVTEDAVALASLDGSRFRRMPAALGVKTAPPTKGTKMEKNDTTAAVENAQSADITKLRAELDSAKTALAKEKKDRIERDLDQCVADGKITRAQRDEWVPKCLADESLVAMVKSLPAKPQTEPVPHAARITDQNDAFSIYKAKATPRERWAFAKEAANEIRAAGGRRGDVSAANTHSGLSTITGTMIADGVVTILQEKCAALRAFARDFGTDRMKPRTPVVVKVVSAGGTAQSNATSFEDSTNFVGTIEPTTVTPAQITVGAHITNAELNSGLAMSDWAEVKGAEMANAIMAIPAAIITTANFTATPLTSAASAFGSAEMNELWGRAKKFGRKAMILDGEYLAQLLPLTKESLNVLEGMNWPGWDGIFLNTVWTGATTNTVGFVADPGRAIGIAAGLPAIPNSASNVLTETVLTVPGVELSVAQYQWFSASSRTEWMTFDVVIGAAKIDGSAGILIKSA